MTPPAPNGSERRRRRGLTFGLCALAAAVVLAFLVVEFRVAFPLAALVTVVGFVALAALLTPRPDPPAQDGELTRAAVAGPVLHQAAHDIGRLLAARSAIADEATRTRLESLAGKAEHILHEISDHPDRLADAQRLLTYYLPRAADLAAHVAACDQRGRGSEDTAQAARAMLMRLEDAFSASEKAVAAHDDKAVSIDLKLLEDALREDFREPR